jgi:hypothetical protein
MTDKGVSHKWGDHYPEACPPDNAKSKDIEPVYRLTLNYPPTDEDFLSHKELRKSYPPELECKACAISVFSNLNQIEKAKKKIVLFKNKGHIVKGKIAKETGVVSEPDHKSHISWWVYSGVEVKRYFEGFTNG